MRRATPLLNFISASLIVVTRLIDRLRADLEYEHYSVPDQRPAEFDPPVRSALLGEDRSRLGSATGA